MLSRLAAAVAAFLGALLATLLFASPAYAESPVDVDISSLSDSMTAGGRADTFTVRLTNTTDQEIEVHRRFVIQLEGLSVDGLRMARGSKPLLLSSTGVGEVQAVDTTVTLGAKDTAGFEPRFGYLIQFLDPAPAGKATITFEALGDGLLGSDSDTVGVKAGANSTTPPPSSTPTTSAPTAAPATTGTAGPAFVVAPLDAEPGLGLGAGSVPPIFYFLGATLVALGGVILWLLLRGPRPALTSLEYPTVSYPAQPYTPQRGPGGSPLPLRKTAIMPVMPNQPPQPPYQAPTDPWSNPPPPPSRR